MSKQIVCRKPKEKIFSQWRDFIMYVEKRIFGKMKIRFRELGVGWNAVCGSFQMYDVIRKFDA
jgi:hypothetical protein